MDHSYLHTLDPFFLQFTESFGIRWYGLAYLGGFAAGYFMTWWLVKKPRMLLPPVLLSDFVFAVAVGCIAGGRLGYCLFYRPDLFFEFRSDLPFWGVLAVHEGGMASHGGVIGMLLACVWFGRREKISILHLGDLVIYGSTLGIFFGRVANFINGELVGRACESPDSPGGCLWSVKFPQDILSWPQYAPEKLASLSSVVGEVGVSPERWERLIAFGEMSSISRVLSVLVEKAQSGSVLVQRGLAEVLTARHPSQLYAAFLEGGLLFVFLFWFWRRPRKPGVISALFLVLYPVGRVISEQFRQPDLHIGYQAFGLTRGQWLSIAMISASLVFLFFVTRRDSAKLGGWATPGSEEPQ
ncbi:prolipoprotein diacylglyceryl transferase [bacterium]|nr:prolipoprotein diacylglyceryl transferase [bacterium]